MESLVDMHFANNYLFLVSTIWKLCKINGSIYILLLLLCAYEMYCPVWDTYIHVREAYIKLTYGPGFIYENKCCSMWVYNEPATFDFWMKQVIVHALALGIAKHMCRAAFSRPSKGLRPWSSRISLAFLHAVHTLASLGVVDAWTTNE